jgi:DNA-binding CsgD family transcriptional regulator
MGLVTAHLAESDILSLARECRITERQLAILCLIAAGHTSGDTAAELHISRHTVAQHIGEILRRFGARSRGEFIARAYAAGLLMPGAWPPQATHDATAAKGFL